MAKSKKKEKEPKKPSVKVEDLTPSANPKGGVYHTIKLAGTTEPPKK